jgi:hypothetical protein
MVEGDIHYQYSKNAMAGGTGSYSFLHYSSPTNSVTLSDSDVIEWTGFWNRRMSRSNYLGLQYQHAHITTKPVKTSTDTDAVYGTYTFYLTNTVSASVLGGPQHYSSEDSVSGLATEAWSPAVQVSAGYQKPRTSIRAGYSHIVTGAGGLIGAYKANTADLAAHRQLSRSWALSADAMYATFSNVTPNIAAANPGGHTISGTITAEHRFTERLRMGLGYTRFHQSYGVFGTGSQIFPDCNRVFASVSYEFSRLLGR